MDPKTTGIGVDKVEDDELKLAPPKNKGARDAAGETLVVDQSDDTATHSSQGQATSSKIKRDPLIGTVVAERYEIAELIGRGATTTVYKAEDKKAHRSVAIKILRNDSIFNEQTIRRFEQECKTLALLKHSNIVALYDSGATESDQPYLVMKYVDGISLNQLIEENNGLDVKRTLNIFIQVCAGLACAHEKGVVHRDMKPANIMLERDAQGHEHVQILDFGVAKFLVQGETFQTKTQTGEMLGTLLYMSPEQCLDQDLDGRCDVYSLGCVIYETLTGKPPLVGRTAFETMNKHLVEMPAKLSKVRPDLVFPMQLEAVIAKAVAKSPNDRYQTVAALQDALRDLLNRYDNLPCEKKDDKTDTKLTVTTPEENSGTLLSQVCITAFFAFLACQIFPPLFVIPLAVLFLIAKGSFPATATGIASGAQASVQRQSREKLLEEIVEKALAGVPWLTVYEGAMSNHGITSEEVETAIAQRRSNSESGPVQKAPAPSQQDEQTRAGVIYFLAMEALDGGDRFDWKTIYADKMTEYKISPDKVVKLKNRLTAAHSEAWAGLEEYTVRAFNELDLNGDGFISKEELQASLDRTDLGLHERSLISFLLEHVDDMRSTDQASASGVKGVQRNDVSQYIRTLERSRSK